MNHDLSSLRIDQAHKDGRRPFRLRRVLFWLFVLALLIAVGLFLARYRFPHTVRTATAALAYPSRGITELTASGYVTAERKAALGSKATAQLIWLGVEEGSVVKKGDVVARLESGDVEAARERATRELEAARHKVDEAQAELTDAAKHFQRMEKLERSHIVSRSTLDEARARLDTATARLNNANAAVTALDAALERTEVEVGYTQLRAPFDAVVLTKNADVGDIISPLSAAANSKAAVISIADMRSLQVQVDVSESNISRVRRGQPCEITLDAFPEERFPGYVHMIVPTADRSKASVMVKVRFDALDPRVLPEMSAKVSFLSRRLAPEELAPRLAVPGAALFEHQGRPAAWVVDQGKARLALLTLGEPLGDLRYVTAGLEPGARVVLSPDPALRAGDPLQVKDQ